MLTELAKNWWVLALRGVAGILFGIAAFVWPGVTLSALVLVFGVYVFVDGVFAVGEGVAMRRQLNLWWLVVLEGVLGIILGVLTFRSPSTTALVLLYFVAVWSILTGLLELATAVRLRKLIEHEWLLIFAGIVSIAFGVLLIARPGPGELSLVYLIGAYALIFGTLTLILSFRIRGLRETIRHAVPGAA